MCYIPDLTERFPEGFGGVDMTSRYCNTMDDLRGLKKLHDEELYHQMMEDSLNDMPDDLLEEQKQTYQFKVGQEFTKVGVFGGVTTYIVKEIDREKQQILLAEEWQDVDGTGTRPAKWHRLELDKDGSEKADFFKKFFGSKSATSISDAYNSNARDGGNHAPKVAVRLAELSKAYDEFFSETSENIA